MKKQHLIGALIVIIAIIALIVLVRPKNTAAPVLVDKDGMKTYTETDFGFTVTFPSDWTFQDNLTGESCCLFIAHLVTSTSTAPNASGTPVVSVTQKELIKLQIGPYDPSMQASFGTSSRQISLNGKKFLTGYTPTGEYFLLARDEQTGIGAAEFRYKETTQADIDAVQKIVGSITFKGTPAVKIGEPQTTATSTKK